MTVTGLGPVQAKAGARLRQRCDVARCRPADSKGQTALPRKAAAHPARCRQAAARSPPVGAPRTAGSPRRQSAVALLMEVPPVAPTGHAPEQRPPPRHRAMDMPASAAFCASSAQRQQASTAPGATRAEPSPAHRGAGNSIKAWRLRKKFLPGFVSDEEHPIGAMLYCHPLPAPPWNAALASPQSARLQPSSAAPIYQ
jgi:hypothetical protein